MRLQILIQVTFKALGDSFMIRLVVPIQYWVQQLIMRVLMLEDDGDETDIDDIT